MFKLGYDLNISKLGTNKLKRIHTKDMKNFILLAVPLILLTSCIKEEYSQLVSTDFDGKFVINASASDAKTVYIADQSGLTLLPIFDSTFINYDGYDWIRNGQYISYFKTQYFWPLGSLLALRVIHPNGTLVHDFQIDFGLTTKSAISEEGNRLALNNYPYYVSAYALNQEFRPLLLDSVISAYGSSIAWAPDEDRFLFEMPGDTAADWVLSVGIAVYEMTTRSVIPIFTYPGPPTTIGSLGWSADGSRVYFTWNHILYIADAKGHGIYPVSDETQEVLYTAWSPAADELAYIRWSPDTDSTEIVIYDPNTGTRTHLPASAFSKNTSSDEGRKLKWSKDGSSIAFVDEYSGLFIINREGTDIRQIWAGPIISFDWYED